jgi:solute:Na+ symporter, SSS family
MTGFVLGAITVGALVAGADSMPAVTCLSRNVDVEYFGPTVIPKRRARIAKAVSLVAKLGAVLFVFGLHDQGPVVLADEHHHLSGGDEVIWLFGFVPRGL